MDIFVKNKEKNIQETLERKIVLESKPLRLGIIVTTWCNLRCIMCPDIRTKNNLTLSYSALSKIEELLPYLEKMDWQGGEFFNLECVKEIFSHLKRYPNIMHEITTNGLLLNEEWIELLLQLKATLTFSIDSPIKEIYEYIRKGAKFEWLIKNLNLIIEYEHRYKKRLTRIITVVVMKSNYHYLVEFIEFVKKYGFESISFDPIVSDPEYEENIFADPNRHGQYLNETASYLKNKFTESGVQFKWNIPQISCGNNSKQDLSPKIITADDVYCNYPWKSMWICASKEGNIFPDCWCREPIGNIFQDSLLEVWNSERMQGYRKRIIANDTSLCQEECIKGYTAAINSKHY
jgi:MoaA/NifB/PqqE/SkfB family radical SAM enzyme